MENDQKCKITILPRGNQKGFALILTMVMLAILSILGVMVLNTTNTELAITSNYRMASEAFVHAEEALEIAKDKILQDRQNARLLVFDETEKVWVVDNQDKYAEHLNKLFLQGINEIASYSGPMPAGLGARFSVDMTSRGNVFRTTADGAGGGSIVPFYRTTVEAEARGRSVARLESVHVDITGL